MEWVCNLFSFIHNTGDQDQWRETFTWWSFTGRHCLVASGLVGQEWFRFKPQPGVYFLKSVQLWGRASLVKCWNCHTQCKCKRKSKRNLLHLHTAATAVFEEENIFFTVVRINPCDFILKCRSFLTNPRKLVCQQWFFINNCHTFYELLCLCGVSWTLSVSTCLSQIL